METEDNNKLREFKKLIENQEIVVDKSVNILYAGRAYVRKLFCSKVQARVKNSCDIEMLIPDDWTLQFVLSSDNDGSYTAICLNAHHKKRYIRLYRIKVNENKTKVIEFYKKFNTIYYEDKLNKKADECVKFILDEIGRFKNGEKQNI